MAVVQIGAATETRFKERKIRVEDALHATRAALEEGIVPGGGVALLRLRHAIATAEPGAGLDEDSGQRIGHRALEAPLRRIVANPGLEPSAVIERVEADGLRAGASSPWRYNAATDEYGGMMAMGVIDPAKVTRLAMQNA